MDAEPIQPQKTPQKAQLAGLSRQVAHAMQNVGRGAGGRDGVDFAYLVKKAAVESGFDPRAKSSSSTATGLYQFTEGTWLDMVESHGSKHGLGREAAEIAAGGLSRERRREVLALREDPGLSTVMAAEYAGDNRAHLTRRVGGELGETELYLAHFLGPSGAETFLKALRSDPEQSAAALLPTAAKANRPVFYDGAQPRSLQQIYDRFEAKFAKTEVPEDLVAALGLDAAAPAQSRPGAIPAGRTGWLAAPMDIRPSFSQRVGIGGWLASPLPSSHLTGSIQPGSLLSGSALPGSALAVSTQVFLSHLALPGESSSRAEP